MHQHIGRPYLGWSFQTLAWEICIPFALATSLQNPPTLVSGVLDLPKLSSPLPPSALGPSPPDVGPNSSIRTLYVYWGQILVDVDQILRRGVPRPTLYVFSSLFDLSELGPYFDQADLCP